MEGWLWVDAVATRMHPPAPTHCNLERSLLWHVGATAVPTRMGRAREKGLPTVSLERGSRKQTVQPALHTVTLPLSTPAG